MSQRRFHECYKLIGDKIQEVYKRTNCPITSIQITHSDGQWRFPDEIIDQNYHPYNQGYGKVSHSGYHSVDMLNYFLSITSKREKKITEVDTFCHFVKPSDVVSQFDYKDYERIFPNFSRDTKYKADDFFEKVTNYGEVDAFINCRFRSGKRTMCLASLNLIHNGFSQRSWCSAEGRDLYKGNGRVRQEFYFIEQGPFQSLLLSSFQSQEMIKEKEVGEQDYEFGGELHSEVHIFRNSTLFHDWCAHETFNIKELTSSVMSGYSRGHQEDARVACIIDFLSPLRAGRFLILIFLIMKTA